MTEWDCAMLFATQSWSSWTRQIQHMLVDGFAHLQPMEYFAIAMVALVVGYVLMSGPR